MDSAKSRKSADTRKSPAQDSLQTAPPVYIALSSGSFHDEPELQGFGQVQDLLSLNPKFLRGTHSKTEQPSPQNGNLAFAHSFSKIPMKVSTSPSINFSFAPDGDLTKRQPRTSKTLRENILIEPETPQMNTLSPMSARNSVDTSWDERARTPMQKKATQHIEEEEEHVNLGDNFAAALVARVKIKGAFNNATENRLFDASNQELCLINDKAYVIDQKEIETKQRINSIKKRKGAKLRQILEKHGIISENLGKKKKKGNQKYDTGRSVVHLCKQKLHDGKKWLKSSYRSILQFYKRVKGGLYELVVLSYIHPQGRFRITWDLLSLMFIFYDLIMVPFTICFDITDKSITFILFVIDFAKDVFFMTDVLFNFKTAYLDDTTLIIHPTLITRKYLKKWFAIDLITSIPFALIIEFIYMDESSTATISAFRLLRFLRFIRLAKIFKAVKLKKIFVKMEEVFYSSVYTGIMSLLSLFGIIALLAHWVACVWHLVGIVVLDSYGNSWLREYNVIDTSISERYITALYWATMTMLTVGYGDIIPVTLPERILTIFVMLLGCATFGYSMNSIGSVVQSIQAGVSKTRQLYYNLTKYMDQKRVSKNIRTKVIQYLDYMIETQKHGKVAEEQLFAILSDNIRDELKKDVNGQVLRENALLQKNFGSKFRGILSNSLEEKIYSPGEVIFDETDKSCYLYFIAAGFVDLYYSDCNVTIKKLERETHFGEIAFFTGGKRTAAAKSATFSDLFYIKRETFLSLIEEYPIDKEQFHRIKDKIVLYEQFDVLQVKCILCGQDGHIARDCHRVHYIPDKELILEKHHGGNVNFLKNFKRGGVKNKYHAKRQFGQLQMKARNFCQLNPAEVAKFLRNNFTTDSFYNLVKQLKKQNGTKSENTPVYKAKSGPSPMKERESFFDLSKPIEEDSKVKKRSSKAKFNPKVTVYNIEPEESEVPEDRNERKLKMRERLKRLKTKIMRQAQENKAMREISKSSEEDDEDDDDDKESSEEFERQAVKISQPRKSKLYRGTTLIQMSGGNGKNLLLEVNGLKLDFGANNMINVKDTSFETNIVMETVANFQIYFPNNNITKILEQMTINRITRRNLSQSENDKRPLFPRRRVESVDEKKVEKKGLLETIAAKARKSIFGGVSPVPTPTNAKDSNSVRSDDSSLFLKRIS